MNKLAENLRFLLTRDGISENVLAEQTGVSQPTINRILRGEIKDPRDNTIAPIAGHYGISVETLRRGDLPAGLTKPARESEYVRIPLYEGFADGQTETVTYVDVRRAWVSERLRGVPIDSIRIITGRGDSMRGTYDDGDVLFVDTRVKKFVDDGAYVFRRDGRVQTKWLQWIGHDTVRILSENTRFPPVEAQLKELEIGGRALAAWAFGEF
jgi:phage repressor protein C with HTH and peptisase S24 domain